MVSGAQPGNSRLDNGTWIYSRPGFDQVPPSRMWTIKLLNEVVEHKDGYTVGHCQRVRDYAQILGEVLGLDSERLGNLLIAAAFHDIGKVGVLARILNKRGPLDHYEWQIIYMHPLLGRELWEGSVPKLSAVARIIHQHHERWDGQGYPEGLAGEEICPEARILSVVDAYDAMLTDRPYRRALSEAKALRELHEGTGSQFDPQVAPVFIELVEGKKLRAA